MSALRGLAWPLTLAGVAVTGSLAAACMMPFVAVATLAAATMPRSQALVAVVGVWAINQLLGFALLGYPTTAQAIGWGAALGVASVAAMLIARSLCRAVADVRLGLPLGFAGAFAGYELLLYAFAHVAGGLGTFTPTIVLQLLTNEAMWLAGLVVLHALLAWRLPRLFAAPHGLRAA